MKNGLLPIQKLYFEFEQEKMYLNDVVRPKMMFAKKEMDLGKFKDELRRYLRTRDFRCRACNKRIFSSDSIAFPIIDVDTVPEYMLYNEINAVLVCAECAAAGTLPDDKSPLEEQHLIYAKDYEKWYDGFMKLLATSAAKTDK